FRAVAMVSRAGIGARDASADGCGARAWSGTPFASGAASRTWMYEGQHNYSSSKYHSTPPPCAMGGGDRTAARPVKLADRWAPSGPRRISNLNIRTRPSTQQLEFHFRSGHHGVGQGIRASFVREGEFFVVEAEGVQKRGVEVVDTHDVFDGLASELVGLPVGVAWAETASGQPQ